MDRSIFWRSHDAWTDWNHDVISITLPKSIRKLNWLNHQKYIRISPFPIRLWSL